MRGFRQSGGSSADGDTCRLAVGDSFASGRRGLADAFGNGRSADSTGQSAAFRQG